MLSEAVRCQIVDTIGRYLKSSKIANKCLGGQEYGNDKRTVYGAYGFE